MALGPPRRLNCLLLTERGVQDVCAIDRRLVYPLFLLRSLATNERRIDISFPHVIIPSFIILVNDLKLSLILLLRSIVGVLVLLFSGLVELPVVLLILPHLLHAHDLRLGESLHVISATEVSLL